MFDSLFVIQSTTLRSTKKLVYSQYWNVVCFLEAHEDCPHMYLVLGSSSLQVHFYELVLLGKKNKYHNYPLETHVIMQVKFNFIFSLDRLFTARTTGK